MCPPLPYLQGLRKEFERAARILANEADPLPLLFQQVEERKPLSPQPLPQQPLPQPLANEADPLQIQTLVDEADLLPQLLFQTGMPSDKLLLFRPGLPPLEPAGPPQEPPSEYR